MSYSELTNENASSCEMVSKMFKEEPGLFNDLSEKQKESFVRRLMDQLESTNRNIRTTAARTVLFIALGCTEYPNILEQANENAAENTVLLCKLGMFPLLIVSLNMERTSSKGYENLERDRTSFNNSAHLRVILNILSLIVGQMLAKKKHGDDRKFVEIFIEENLASEEEGSLLFILFDMMREFAVSEKPGYPIKKILLLILKIIMISFGDLRDLCIEKRKMRTMYGLDNDQVNVLDLNVRMYKFPLSHKVSTQDLDNYIHSISLKYKETKGTVAAESIKSLRKHLYVPLSELQVNEKCWKRNEKIENLYQNMLPKMKMYIQGLLQIFQSSLRSPVFNELAQMNEETVLTSMMIWGKLRMFEHMEVMNKAISGILLLLLKHFKFNHIYQFEYLCQEMIACNALHILKTYVETTSDLFITLNQRNLTTCVNVLRILNKLTKGKFTPVKTLLKVNIKSLHTLSILNDKHLEVYSLKLLKMISKPLGRKWRQDNIKIMNKIFQNVRPRLLEDWNCPFLSDKDDEDMLKKRIEFFNTKYNKTDLEKEFEIEGDSSFELTDYFKNNYEKWLEVQVFQNPFDWDVLLKT